MGREKVLLMMSFPGILIPLSYTIYFHKIFITDSDDLNLLYNSFIKSLIITSFIFITLFILLYFFSVSIGGLILYVFFSFMGYLVNLFNSSIIMIIIQKLFNIYLGENVKGFIFYTLGILMSIYGHIRAELIYFDKHNIQVEYWQKEKENMKVKIAHLSDLHLCPIYGRKLVEKIVSKLNNENGISFVVLTGDIVDGDMFDNRISLSILEPFKKLKYKIYYVSGNHEEFTDKVRLFYLLEKVGIINLDNKIEVLSKYKINLIGIGFDKDYQKIRNETIPELCEISNENNYINVVLSHIPFFKPEHLVRYNIFLFLCGHTHGAQMIPTNIYIWCKNTVLNGLYSYLNKYFVYCVSGVGNSGPPLRTFARANIGLITLTN
jgi:predicted MPP superfamily phosphohydrolase